MNRPAVTEVLRYLGSYGMSDQADLALQAENALSLIEKHSACRSIHQTFPLIPLDDRFLIGDAVFESRSLFRNLKGCSEVVIMACTLGPEPDRLIRRAQVTSLFDTALLQAACTAWIEAYCDEVNQEIIDEAKKRSLYCRPRYSPGYGDLALESQADVFRLLPIKKQIGVSLTEGFLMVPTKSVTALIGLSDTERNCILSGCEECDRNKACIYSRTELANERNQRKNTE